MENEKQARPDAAEVTSDALLARRDFLRRFASVSVAAILLGVSTGCIPRALYGPNPEAVYGPPPVATSTPEPTPDAVYGPAPVEEPPQTP